jgi:hypothetical protein
VRRVIVVRRGTREIRVRRVTREILVHPDEMVIPAVMGSMVRRGIEASVVSQAKMGRRGKTERRENLVNEDSVVRRVNKALLVLLVLVLVALVVVEVLSTLILPLIQDLESTIP